MRSTPIIFSTSMVRAILDGRKTQTRRCIAQGHVACDSARLQDLDFGSPSVRVDASTIWERNDVYLHVPHMHQNSTHRVFPRVQSGDILWVRESFWRAKNSNMIANVADGFPDEWSPTDAKKHPSIHMPKSIARIWLRVTRVRLERLQDITECDAEAEGVKYSRCIGLSACGGPCDDCYGPFSARDAFHSLWDSLNATRGYGWQSNPWVVVIDFKQVRKPMEA